jgi:hypothetical protein
MQVHTTKVLAASATNDGFQDRSVQQWTTDPIEQLYLDQVLAHMGLLTLASSMASALFAHSLQEMG